MKILTLSIKQNYFDEIKAGTKPSEFREIKPTTQHSYIRYVDDAGNELKEPSKHKGAVHAEPIKYDAIKFLTGAYIGTRPSMIVEVKDAIISVVTDENDKEITYQHDGQEYVQAEIEYKLGKVLDS